MEFVDKGMSGWKMLPPHKDCCQICAAKHEPEQPHDPQSIFYQTWFFATFKRAVTWNDALAHCSEEVKEQWGYSLAALKIDPASTNVSSPFKTLEEVKAATKEGQDNYILAKRKEKLDQ